MGPRLLVLDDDEGRIAAAPAMARLRDDGTQAGLVDRMQTRARLYELLGYRDYAAFDRRVHDFEL